MAFPLRLKGRHVDDDAAARIGALAQADGQHVARDAKELDRARQGKGVRRDDADIAFDVDKALLIEVLRVNGGRIDIGEHLEFIGAANIVTVAGDPVGDQRVSAFGAHLTLDEGLDHAVLLGHATNPFIRFDAHGDCPELKQR